MSSVTTIEEVDEITIGINGETSVDYVIYPHARKITARKGLSPETWYEIGCNARLAMDGKLGPGLITASGSNRLRHIQ